MRVITIVNPKVMDVPYTLISSDYNSGTSLTVEDSSGFADNDLVLVGSVGDEKAETTALTSSPPNSTSLAVTSMNFNHDADESVAKVLYDQYDIQYATSLGGAWNDLVLGQNFDWGKERTDYIHEAGLPTYYYRSRYYNSATAAYSDYSDTVVGTGYTRMQVGWLVDRVRTKAQDTNKQAASDKDIIASFNTVNDMIRGLNRRWWFLKTDKDYSTVASTGEYDLPDNYDRAYRVKYAFNDGTSVKTYYLRYLPVVEFDSNYGDSGANPDDELVHYTIDDVSGKLKVGPKPETNTQTITFVYFKTLDDVVTYGDVVPIPLPDLYVHYATSEIWTDKDNADKAVFHQNQFTNMLKILEEMRVKNYFPRQMLKWKGRRVMNRWYGSSATSQSDREKYY